ncbi:mechanosensitive ion channel [Pirellulales bacterium]|nr:mechanosensitive ion channel [Pirellulales bacterium]
MRSVASSYCQAFLLALVAMAHAGGTALGQITVQGPLLQSPQPTTSVEGAAPITAEHADVVLQQQRTEVQQRIRLAQQARASEEPAPSGDTTRKNREVELLKQLEVTLDRRQAAQKRTEQLQADHDQGAQEIEQLRRDGLEEAPPYSFLLLDTVRDSIKTQTARVEALGEAAEEAVAALERAAENAKLKRRELDDAGDAVDANKSERRRESLAAGLREAETGVKIAAATVELSRTELENDRLELAVEQQRLKFLREKLAMVASQAVFTDEDLQTRLLELDNLEEALKRDREDKQFEQDYLQQQWAQAQKKADDGDGPAAVLRAEVDAWHEARTGVNEIQDLLGNELAMIAEARDFWDQRFRVASDDYDTANLTTWESEAETFLEKIAKERRWQDAHLQDARKLLSDVERQTQAAEADNAETVEALQRKRQALRRRIDAINNYVVRMDSLERLAGNLIAEIDARRANLNVWDWAYWAWAKAKSVWDYPLALPEEARPIRVSTVIKGLLLLILGIWISRRVSDAIGKRLLPRFGVQEGAAAALTSLVFYALVFTSALMALRNVQVPLTVFTFLGGAIAIGIGFGSQNLLNNFISGLTMLVEQPVRVGDLVELQDLAGTIEAIGMRSTRIRTQSNLEMIVPNSFFLENQVLNWTLSDSTVRCKIDVGVAYGSPTREVARWLRQAADKHGLVLRKPEPFVWFTGFGDNALLFELHFFIVIRTMAERRRIESDLRFMIDQLLRDASITIAFPQRDLHLHASKPLEFRMAPAETEPPEAPAA